MELWRMDETFGNPFFIAIFQFYKTPGQRIAVLRSKVPFWSRVDYYSLFFAIFSRHLMR